MSLAIQKFCAVALLVLAASQAFAGMPTHLLTSEHGSFGLPMPPAGNHVSMQATFESGRGWIAFNDLANKTGLTTMYQDGQAVIRMLRSPQPSVARALADAHIDPRLAFAVDYGGRRGIMDFRAGYSQTVITLATGAVFPEFFIPGRWRVGALLPLVSKRVHAVTFKPRTGNFDVYDRLLEAQLYQPDFAAAVKKLGGPAIVSDWNASGIGDLTLRLDWDYNLAHGLPPTLRSATLHAGAGWLIPTADQQPEDIMFAQPLGSDGHWGLPFDLGFELLFAAPVKFGMGLDLVWLLDQRRDRRLKTDPMQTDFLLLNKGSATKQQGMTWRLHIDVEGHRLWRGLSVKGSYEFLMHHNDRLYSRSPEFSDAVINTAASLRSWYLHTVAAKLAYDLTADVARQRVGLACALFVRYPFAGRRAVKAPSFGGELALVF